MDRIEFKKNFNIASTVINKNIRISTAAIFYDEWFGEYYQFETIVFKTKDSGEVNGMIMKIHNVLENQEGIDYCLRFHKKSVALISLKVANLI